MNHFQARPCPIKIKHKSSFFNPAPKKELDLLFWQAKVNHCTCSLWKNAYHGNVNNVTSIATMYWCINVDSTFVYFRPLDFNKDSNNHICWRQMLYKGLVIIITASFSDCKTFGKSLRISVKFCHWNPKNSEILSKLRNSELAGASDCHCFLGRSLMSKCVPKSKVGHWLSDSVSQWHGHLLSCQVTAKNGSQPHNSPRLRCYNKNIARIANAVQCHNWLSGNNDCHEFRFSIVRIVISVAMGDNPFFTWMNTCTQGFPKI